MQYVKANDSEDPKCPHCDAKLTKVKFKNLANDGFGKRKLIFFCPSCNKVLGFSDADVSYF